MAQWNPPGPGEFRVPGVPSPAFQRADGSWVAPLAELPPGAVAERGNVLKRTRPAADEPAEAPFAKRPAPPPAARPPPPPFQPRLEPHPSFDEWAHHRWSTGATCGDADQVPEAVVVGAPTAGAPTLAPDPEGPSRRANRYVTTNGYY